ncbi:Ecdysteroid-regulated 16 kDa protein like [Argiope bruennichi]|uniref:Ecdysteroid-regulated 16 kDa protein like n=1 Tax=Argiope bruennichi TaxID=94029 RepID=A0A8T0FKD3_ARGBR|nr:Ecdysteroid-regulated 16 kDa protein like [Argiope bruennichi]
MSNRKITVVLLFVASFFIKNGGVHCSNITDCGSSDNVKIHDIKVSYCDDVDLCPLIRGDTTILTMNFEVGSEVKNLTAWVQGTIDDGDMFLPFPYKHRYVCAEELGLECPLIPGKIYTYTTPIEIKQIFPKIRSVVKWELKDRKKVVICILIPSRIVDEI